MNEEEAKRILMELSTFDYVKLENGDVAIETVLNLLEKKDREIKRVSSEFAIGKKQYEELIDDYEKLNLKSIEQQKEIEKKDKQLKGLEEIDKRRTWTVNKVISEYIPDYEIISLINRYKDESFIPRVEVEKILNDRKK